MLVDMMTARNPLLPLHMSREMHKRPVILRLVAHKIIKRQVGDLFCHVGIGVRDSTRVLGAGEKSVVGRRCRPFLPFRLSEWERFQSKITSETITDTMYVSL